MQVYTELLPPTAVTHALYLPFISKKAQNLIVVKTSLLQIYKIKQLQDVLETTTNDVNGNAADPQSSTENARRPQYRLVLVGEYALSGTVTSIAGIKAMNTKSGGLALLISVKDAKISLVEWDPEIYNISTLSIHYYEGDDLQGAPWAPDLAQCDSYLTVDPSSRCAALKFGQRHLAILPFRQPGDDLAMGEFDPDQESAGVVKVNGEAKKATPYASSFVLPLTALDSTLIHPIDLAFLYEYREPTLGVLASPQEPALSLIQQRKDILTYTVFTLDIEQRARTPLLSVSGLPADLFKLLPLPLPVGGTLLVGGNEVIHIDQSGKTTAVAVNEFARECSSFSMVDQSDLRLKLEHCTVEQIDKATGEMLFILDNGDFAMLSFKLDGRSVNSLSIRRVPAEQTGTICPGSLSCAVLLGDDLVFLGSEDCDALLISCERAHGAQQAKKRSHAEMLGLGEEEEEDEDVDDEDDLYGGDAVITKAVALIGQAGGSMSEITFRVQDTLINLSPQGAPTFSPSSIRQKTSENMSPGIDIVMATGSGHRGSLSFITKGIKPDITRTLELDNASDVWALRMKSETNEQYDNVLIISHTSADDSESSSIHSITAKGVSARTGTDFESGSATLNASVLGGGTRLVQITHSEVRCYDTDLGLAQIFPMIDEETDEERKIVASSFCDPYILLIRDDNSSMVLKLDRKGELDEVEGGEPFKSSEWISGCLHHQLEAQQPLVYLLNLKGTLNVYQLPDLSTPSYVTDLRNLPSNLTANGVAKRLGSEQAALVEVLICNIGDSIDRSTYMIVRSDENELAVFEPYHYPTSTKSLAFTNDLRWRKVLAVQPSSLQDAYPVDAIPASTRSLLRCVTDCGGRSVAVMQNKSVTMIVKESTSTIRSIQLEGSLTQALSSINAEMCPSGLLTVTSSGLVNVSKLNAEINYGTTGWAVHRVDLKENVESVCFHADSSAFVVATSSKTNFFLPEDDWHPEWAEENIAFRPQIDQGALKLVDSISQTVIQEMVFDPDESILSMKIIDLEISERTHERKPMIVVGTAKIQGEDYGCGGSIYVFDIMQVVPDPEHPERNKSLKMIAKEDLRGPVTALSELGDQGLLIAAQGQKIMVRGLKEDNTLLPVAFLDVQTMVTSIKNVRGTGLVLVADAMKGLWLIGFSTEPYTLRVFGKSRSHMEVLTAEFLPQEKQLFILVADDACNIHVLEFNPEDPKSLSGQRLLHRSTFHTGHHPTSMLLLPSTTTPTTTDNLSGDENTNDTDSLTSTPTSSILLTTASGALALLTPLDESTYRRLGALQIHLSTILDHPCGLNPRAFRAVESEGYGGRGILDGQILKRWRELSSQKKIEACKRIGEEMAVVRGWLRDIEGGGMVYL